MKQFIIEAKRFQKLAGINEAFINTPTEKQTTNNYYNAEVKLEVEFAPEFVDQSIDTENTWTNPDTGKKYRYEDVVFYGEVGEGGDPWWDTDQYTDMENEAIEQWFRKNRDEVEEALIEDNLNGVGSPI